MPFPFPFTLFGASRASADTGCTFTYCYGGGWVQGKVGNYGLDFDAGTESVIVAPAGSFSGAQERDTLTVAAWINLDATSGGGGHGQSIIGKWYYTGNERSWSARELGGVLAWDLTEPGTWLGNYVTRRGSTSLSTDTWYHAMWVYDKDNAKCDIYLNGALDNGATTGTPNFTINEDASNNPQIGAYNYPGTEASFFNGTIDELAVWNVALTASHAVALYNSGDGARADSITPPAASDGAWVSGKVDTYALDFAGNGSDDYVDLPAGAVSGSNSNATSGTMAAWIYPEANSNYEMIFSKAKNGSAYYIYWSMTPTTNAPRLTFWNGSAQKTYTSTTVVPLNQWSHVAVSSDDTDIYFYVNGTASAGTGDTGASWFGDLDSDATKTSIGALWYNTDPRYEFNGKIDEFAIWTEALDIGAIKELYADGVGAKANTVSSSVLVSYYDFEDGPASTTLTDQTANGYNGTLENFSDTGTTGSLLMYYDFEIGDSNPVSGNFPTSTTVYDVDTVAWKSPTMHTGTMTNMSVADFGAWDQGKIGKYSLNFSGTTDSVEVANNSAINFTTSDFSVAFWVSSSTSAGRLQGFINKAKSAGYVHDGWIIGRNYQPGSGLGTTNELLFSTRNDSLSPDYAYTFTDSTYDDDWHHVVAVRTGTSNKLYVDGVDAAASVSTMASLGAVTDNLRIGQWWNHASAGNDYSLSGKMDEVGIWNVALDSGAISDLYGGVLCSAVSSSNLVLYYDFECNGPGSPIAKDLSGNNLSGTLTNMISGSCGSG